MLLLLADLGTMIPLFCQLQSVLVNVWFFVYQQYFTMYVATNIANANILAC